MERKDPAALVEVDLQEEEEVKEAKVALQSPPPLRDLVIAFMSRSALYLEEEEHRGPENITL